MAKCPAHHEKTGSLSITDMGQGKTRLHCFGGCDQADVLRAAGLEWKDLRPGDVPESIKRQMSLEDHKESLERQRGLARWIAALEPDKRKMAYWRAAWKRISSELLQVRLQLEPSKVLQEHREKRFQEKVRNVGWDGIWEEFWRQHDGKLPNAGICTELREREIRSDSLRGASRELHEGRIQARR
jgi:hypothetical protein